MHRINGPHVHLHDVALRVFVCSSTPLEKNFFHSQKTSTAGTVGGCHVVTGAAVKFGMFKNNVSVVWITECQILYFLCG